MNITTISIIVDNLIEDQFVFIDDEGAARNKFSELACERSDITPIGYEYTESDLDDMLEEGYCENSNCTICITTHIVA